MKHRRGTNLEIPGTMSKKPAQQFTATPVFLSATVWSLEATPPQSPLLSSKTLHHPGDLEVVQKGVTDNGDIIILRP